MIVVLLIVGVCPHLYVKDIGCRFFRLLPVPRKGSILDEIKIKTISKRFSLNEQFVVILLAKDLRS